VQKTELFAIDLFAGVGGLMEGFKRAGINFIAHVEKDKYCCETIKTRLFYHFLKENNEEDLYYKYLYGEIGREEFLNIYPAEFQEIAEGVINTEINDQNLPAIIHTICERIKRKNLKNIDIVIGGPPCQAYSLVGRARDPYNMEKDPRNYLYRYYVSILEEFKPEVFVFENVPGILTAGKGKLFKDIQQYFKNAGYEIEYRILNSADFFVLQNRKRVILMGWKKGSGLRYPTFEKIDHNYKVKDLLSDLPPLKPGEGEDRKPLQYSGPPSDYLIKAGIRSYRDVVIHHKARNHRAMDREIYRIAIEYYRNGKKLRYTDLPEHLQTHRNKDSFLDRFKVVDWEAPFCHTVVAHISKDGHYYIHPDINQLRSITVREAARIQSFPDNYIFEGPRTQQFIQVGNAVPPLMAYCIAVEIRRMLE
jgi:DNA (cytosine-5)-methyltransferase 1